MFKLSMKPIALLAASAFCTLVPSLARADYDIRPYVSGNVFYTGGYDDVTTYTEGARSSFGFDLDEDGTTDDPGFNTGGFTLDASTALNFDVDGDLEFWDGSTGDFAPAPSGTTLELSRDTSYVDVTGSSSSPSGFTIDTSDISGHLHKHLATALTNGNDAPAVGIYKIRIHLYEGTSGPGTYVYVLFNYGVDEETFQAAIDTANGD